MKMECEECGCKAVGVIPVYEKGEWIGNKKLCKECIGNLPVMLPKKKKKNETKKNKRH